MKKINICGIGIKVYFVDENELNEEYSKGIVKREKTELCGLANVKELKIFINKDMHDFMIRKTLIHEATHILIEIKNELIPNIQEINFHEMLAVFVSENFKEINDIKKQVDDMLSCDIKNYDKEIKQVSNAKSD